MLTPCLIRRGAFLAYRIALWYPDLVTHLFTACVPYSSPRKDYFSLEESVRTILPHFGYQLQFRSGEVEKSIKGKDDIRNFLSALYGGRTADDDESAFVAEKGVSLGKRVRPSRLLGAEVRRILHCYSLLVVLSTRDSEPHAVRHRNSTTTLSNTAETV